MRFAIICRVSSDEQLKGESLAVQEKMLTQCISNLGGEIVKRYIGSESAMGKKERPILEEMLADCSRGIFDAVCCYDLSRLTRDPIKGKIIQATLKKNKIKLFLQGQEYDLTSPENTLMVGLLSEINQFHVNIQTKKVMESRIELARRGYPISTSPHGRRLISTDKSKPAVYEVIPEAKQEAETFWDLYVNQKLPLKKIAEICDTNLQYIHSVLFRYSGSEWLQQIDYDGKDELIITPMPPLLTDEQIQSDKDVSTSSL